MRRAKKVEKQQNYEGGVKVIDGDCRTPRRPDITPNERTWKGLKKKGKNYCKITTMCNSSHHNTQR